MLCTVKFAYYPTAKYYYLQETQKKKSVTPGGAHRLHSIPRVKPEARLEKGGKWEMLETLLFARFGEVKH